VSILDVLDEILGILEIDRLKLSGSIVLKGTRIELEMLLDMMENGYKPIEIIEEFPHLEKSKIELIYKNLEMAKTIYTVLSKIRRNLIFKDGKCFLEVRGHHIPLNEVKGDHILEITGLLDKLDKKIVDRIARSLVKIVKPLDEEKIKQIEFLEELRMIARTERSKKHIRILKSLS